jgi:hypothetical protein
MQGSYAQRARRDLVSASSHPPSAALVWGFCPGELWAVKFAWRRRLRPRSTIGAGAAKSSTTSPSVNRDLAIAIAHQRLGDRPVRFLAVTEALAENLHSAAGHAELIFAARHSSAIIASRPRKIREVVHIAAAGGEPSHPRRGDDAKAARSRNYGILPDGPGG